ncbi:MAG: ATP-grasp domain-containing protein [Rhodanobacteraceae bacterium]
MNLKIAIQADEVVHRNGERQSYSRRWVELAAQQGITAVTVDAFAQDAIAQISACDAFMWRYDPAAHPRLYAKRLLYAIEEGLGMPVFPSLKSSWHFEDKIGQYYFLSAAGIPTPVTQIFWSRQQAERFCDSAEYPFVLKLAAGYQASNVRLVHDRDEALFYVDELFGHGVIGLGYRPASRPRLLLRRLRAVSEIARGLNPFGPTAQAELEYGYFFAQEFLPGNDFDVRVTITGDRAFGFRRFNRPGDFRASGSGRIDWDPAQIGEAPVRFAYRVARQLGAQTVALDILRRSSEFVIVELTLAYASWAVRDCPGHWILKGEPGMGELEWVEGRMHPEDAIFSDFVAEVRHAHSVCVRHRLL